MQLIIGSPKHMRPAVLLSALLAAALVAICPTTVWALPSPARMKSLGSTEVTSISATFPTSPRTQVSHSSTLTTHGRIVAIGDLHGDLQVTERVLLNSGIIDKTNKWIAKDTILVITGDVVDRGPDTKHIYDLINALTEEAARQPNCHVIMLLGNHEVMNLAGKYKHVMEPADPDGFGGWPNRIKEFSTEGQLGRWLRHSHIAANINGNIFSHGGITPELAIHLKSIDKINAEATHALTRDNWRAPILDKDGKGPLWFEGYAEDVQDRHLCDAIDTTLKQLGGARMVMGHNTQKDGQIHTRCAGKLVLIDVGMSASYGFGCAALEIRGEEATALYCQDNGHAQRRLPNAVDLPEDSPLKHRTHKLKNKKSKDSLISQDSMASMVSEISADASPKNFGSETSQHTPHSV